MIRQPRLGYLVADGRRAQLMLRHASGDYHILQTITPREGRPHPRADSRVRVFQPDGGRTALEPDHQLAADRRRRRFAADLAAALEGAVADGRFEDFVVAAPPRMLRAIREELGPAARAHIRRELPRDITKLATAELHRRLDDLTLAAPAEPQA